MILLIAAAFGVGAAIESTGLAAQIAATAGRAPSTASATSGIVFAIVLTTTLLTEVITNNAAAVVIFPIAISVAPRPASTRGSIAIAIAIRRVSSFLTPMGYQTNTMVYGPGGYRFSDYLRLGIPVNLVVAIAITGMTLAMA